MSAGHLRDGGDSAPQDDAEVVVPKTALQSIKGERVVFVRSERGFEARKVAIGREDDAPSRSFPASRPERPSPIANTFILKAELGKAEAEHHD